MKLAVNLVRDMAKKGDTVLLSPGAASFGIFENEFDRGAQFVKAVLRL
jgi:UDP-N-acetylmuramoylalanine--D-glutamate ligase